MAIRTAAGTAGIAVLAWQGWWSGGTTVGGWVGVAYHSTTPQLESENSDVGPPTKVGYLFSPSLRDYY